ncbi:hypothetical protein B0A50_03251 [Salinomyces thailandicus]|uniref:Pinin/SDK/MemA protein domain-containing protein n=1 Tax=Salinomyces thailandicus TaxID=706561 RepID=A0A4U0U4T9_9PEZI|nr:hypothetical protein B0A50_03251 [Salinomyces thailandica]
MAPAGTELESTAELTTETERPVSAKGNGDAQANGRKRRASDEAEVEVEVEADVKRRRTSLGHEATAGDADADADVDADKPNGTTAPAVTAEAQQKQDTPLEPSATSTTNPSPPRTSRRKPSAVDEKKRSQRLFGALLGPLNHAPDRTTKRRHEIETRRKTELAQQDVHNQVDAAQRLQRLREHRAKVLKEVVEPEVRELRWRQVRVEAGFLRTKAEPVLFWRPWEMREEEVERVEGQEREVEEMIGREREEWEGWRDGEKRGGEVVLDSQPAERMSEVGDEAPEVVQRGEHDADTGVKITLLQEQGQEQVQEQRQEQEVNGDHDDHGDHVVEGDEDTVIY